MERRRWAVVAQGPLTSAPRAGAEQTAKTGTTSAYPSVGAIRMMWETIGRSDLLMIVSTWDGTEDLQSATELSPEIDVVHTPDPGRPNAVRGTPWDDNRYRQIVSSLAGLARARALGATHAVRVRVDQVVPVLEVIATVEADDRSSPVDPIHVSSLYADGPWTIGDFFFAGAIGALESFFEANERRYADYLGSSSVHGAFPRIDAAENYFPSVGVDPVLATAFVPRAAGFRPAFGYTPELAELWAAMIKDRLRPLPRAISEATMWRGEPIEILYRQLFAEDVGDEPDAATVASLWPDWFAPRRRPWHRITDFSFETADRTSPMWRGSLARAPRRLADRIQGRRSRDGAA